MWIGGTNAVHRHRVVVVNPDHILTQGVSARLCHEAACWRGAFFGQHHRELAAHRCQVPTCRQWLSRSRPASPRAACPTRKKTNSRASFLSTMANGMPALLPEFTTQLATYRASGDARSVPKSASGCRWTGVVAVTVPTWGRAPDTPGGGSNRASAAVPISKPSRTLWSHLGIAREATALCIVFKLGWPTEAWMGRPLRRSNQHNSPGLSWQRQGSVAVRTGHAFFGHAGGCSCWTGWRWWPHCCPSSVGCCCSYPSQVPCGWVPWSVLVCCRRHALAPHWWWRCRCPCSSALLCATAHKRSQRRQ